MFKQTAAISILYITTSTLTYGSSAKEKDDFVEVTKTALTPNTSQAIPPAQAQANQWFWSLTEAVSNGVSIAGTVITDLAAQAKHMVLDDKELTKLEFGDQNIGFLTKLWAQLPAQSDWTQMLGQTQQIKTGEKGKPGYYDGYVKVMALSYGHMIQIPTQDPKAASIYTISDNDEVSFSDFLGQFGPNVTFKKGEIGWVGEGATLKKTLTYYLIDSIKKTYIAFTLARSEKNLPSEWPPIQNPLACFSQDSRVLHNTGIKALQQATAQLAKTMTDYNNPLELSKFPPISLDKLKSIISKKENLSDSYIHYAALNESDSGPCYEGCVKILSWQAGTVSGAIDEIFKSGPKTTEQRQINRDLSIIEAIRSLEANPDSLMIKKSVIEPFGDKTVATISYFGAGVFLDILIIRNRYLEELQNILTSPDLKEYIEHTAKFIYREPTATGSQSGGTSSTPQQPASTGKKKK